MSASEFAFLALGLMLGVASGAALLEVLRSRPPAPRQVLVTVAPDSVPVRATTLATDPFAIGVVGPAPFGPGDRRRIDRPEDLSPAFASRPPGRTPVPPAGMTATTAVALARARAYAGPSRGYAEPAESPLATEGRTPVGIVITPEVDGLFEALRAADVRAAIVLGGQNGGGANGSGATDDTETSGHAWVEAGAAAGAAAVATLTAVADPTEGSTGGPADEPADRPLALAGESPPDPAEPKALPRTGPCAELHAIAEDRCAVAERARSGAAEARDRSREAQRAYDDHLTRADEAERIADPRAVRLAKEAAQQVFRTARDSAADRDALEAAAAAWLTEVNRINAAARDAAARAAREHASANALVVVIERLTVEADAARISAESAQEACIAARQAAADCEEQALLPPPVEVLEPPPEFGTRYPEEAPGLPNGEHVEAPSDREARMVRLLRGDGEALHRTVAELAGDDPEERRRWQLELTALVDAITAQAIEASAIDVAPDHPFWHPFSQVQSRDIISALASLGYRYDGLGGFADGRVPSQRDLSLAIGYAGLDPMRIRIWPTEHEMAGLFAGASVAADSYLIEAAGGLTLGELVALLGSRADGLTDLWNEWGRVRPRLLATD